MWFSEVSRGFWWQSRLVVGLQASATAPAPALHLMFLAAQGQGECDDSTESVTSEGAICVGTPLAPADVPA